MKSIIVALAIGLGASTVNAQLVPHKIEVVCGSATEIVNQLRVKYKELPMIVHENKELGVSFVTFVNQKSSSWTIASFDFSEGVGCVLGSGVGVTHKATI